MKPVKIHQLKESAYPANSPMSPSQMMSYVIETGDGSIVVIDGGYWGDATYLWEYLKKLGGETPTVKAWFMTHAHTDHFTALDSMITSNRLPKIEALYLNFCSEEFQRKTSPNQAVYTASFMEHVKEAGLPLKIINEGDVITIDDVVFKIIYFAGENITANQPNNDSTVIRMEACGQSVLFSGDIGVEASDEMLSRLDSALIKADIVQMAHHGQSGADEKFYKAVNPKACLWPTPAWLWNNDLGDGFNTSMFTTVETRKWMKKLGVKHHIITKDGTQVITLPVNFDEPWGVEDNLEELN